MFVFKFYYIFAIIKLNDWYLTVQSLPFNDYSNKNNNSNNNNNNIDNNNSNNSTVNLEIKLNRTAVNVTQINDLEVQSNDYIPRFHLYALKNPQSFLTLNPISSRSILPPQNAHIHFYAESPLLSLNKVPYGSLGKFLIPQLSDTNTRRIEESNVNNILGSGDFGVIQGGTFYPPEEMPYHIKNHNDYSRGNPTTINEETTNTDGLIHKYTPANEQFERFHDFADLTSPNMDTDFTKYIAIYVANHTNTNVNANTSVNAIAKIEAHNKNDVDDDADEDAAGDGDDVADTYEHQYPENIYEQLLKIDEEKLNKFSPIENIQSHNKNKLKFHAHTWLLKKPHGFSLSKKQSNDIQIDDKDPLLALS